MSIISRTIFGPGPAQKRGYCGHQEIELALVKLYRLTGDRKHLDLAAYFINERGAQPHYFDEEARARGEDPKDFWAKTYEYNQSHKPVREQTKVVGHAVRAMYMYSAMADLAVRAGRRRPAEGLRDSLERRHRHEDVLDCGPWSFGTRTRASPQITICPTTPPMPRPAPRSR